MNTIKKQNGMSPVGMMSVVLLIVFAAVTVMKLWGPYYDDLAVKTAVENVSKEETVRSMTPKEVLDTLNKRLSVNQVTLTKDEVKVKKEDGLITVDVVYERRIPMYGNIDAMVKFNHSAVINARGS